MFYYYCVDYVSSIQTAASGHGHVHSAEPLYVNPSVLPAVEALFSRHLQELVSIEKTDMSVRP